MAVELVLRNGTAAENDAFTGALAEVTVDKTNNTLRVHDGSTPGGTPLLTGGSSGATLTDITLAGTTTVSGQIDSDLIPSSDVTYDLGSPTNRWNDLYLSGNTIDIGGATISVVGGSFEFKDSGGGDAAVSLAANTTDDLAEGTANLYAAQPVGTADDVTFNSVTVDGDLTVNGTTTTLNTTTLDVEDINITVANGAADATAADGAGLTIDLGTDGTADFTYDSANDRLTSNKSIATNIIGDVTGTVSDISNHDTDDLSEGTSNLYYTDARVDAHLSGGSGIDFSAGAISHADTSAVNDVTSSSNTFVDALTFDGFGHVTAVSTSTAAPPNDATITVSAGTGLSGGGNFTTDQSGNETITLDVDTSTIATRSYVDTEVSNLVDSSPATLDTLNELAAALGDDPAFATTVSNNIGTKADKTTDINAGSGLTGGGDLSANRTISHADTSSQSSVNNSGTTFIQDITLDGFGHITNINSATVSGFAQENTNVTFNTVTADNFNSTSDVRKKTNIDTISDATDKVKNLRGVSFNWTESGESSMGLIAQELEQVIPEVVSTDEEGLKSVSYGNLVGLLVEAIKDQQNQINELKTKVYK